jgi:hypothetical protein
VAVSACYDHPDFKPAYPDNQLKLHGITSHERKFSSRLALDLSLLYRKMPYLSISFFIFF